MDQNNALMLMIMYKLMKRKKSNKPAQQPRVVTGPELPTANFYHTMMKTHDPEIEHPDALRLFGDRIVMEYEFEQVLYDFMLTRCNSDYTDKQIEHDGKTMCMYEHLHEFAYKYNKFLVSYIFDVPGRQNGLHEVWFEPTNAELSNVSTVKVTADNNNLRLDNMELSIFVESLNAMFRQIYYEARVLYKKAGGNNHYVNQIFVTGIHFLVADGKAIAYDIEWDTHQ